MAKGKTWDGKRSIGDASDKKENDNEENNEHIFNFLKDEDFTSSDSDSEIEEDDKEIQYLTN